MTALLEKAIGTAQSLAPDVQDELAELMLAYTDSVQDLDDLSPEDEAAINESIEAAERGDFATDEEMRALWAKYGL